MSNSLPLPQDLQKRKCSIQQSSRRHVRTGSGLSRCIKTFPLMACTAPEGLQAFLLMLHMTL